MNKRLKNIIADLKNIEIIESHYTELLKLKADQEIKLEEINHELERRNTKIESLQQSNFKSIYLKLIGGLKIKLELHEKHFLNLSLEFNDISKSVDLLTYEIDLIEKKLRALKEKKKELRLELKKHKRNYLDQNLNEYKVFANSLEYHLKLAKEIEEAIKEGKSLNYKFNAILRLIKKVAKEIYSTNGKDIEKLNKYKVNQIEKYQNHIIKINHGFAKYVREINDVYNVILENNKEPDSGLTNFMKHYRINLSNDLRKAKDLANSYKFLKRYKDIIMSINQTLRNDLKSISKRIEDLEIKERKILKSISKKT